MLNSMHVVVNGDMLVRLSYLSHTLLLPKKYTSPCCKSHMEIVRSCIILGYSVLVYGSSTDFEKNSVSMYIGDPS